jgi:hypothetical protein
MSKVERTKEGLMRRRLIVLATAIILGVSLLVPAAVFAGGDQVHRPAPGELQINK